MDWQQKTGEDSYFLTGDHVREKEPYLSESIIGAVYYPKDGHVIAPELTKAFAHSAAISGADIYEQTEVFDIRIENNKVTGVITSEGIVTCESRYCRRFMEHEVTQLFSPRLGYISS